MGWAFNMSKKIMSNMNAGEGKGIFANTFGFKEGYMRKTVQGFEDAIKRNPDNHGITTSDIIGKISKDYMTGADYAGDGWRRAGALAARHGTAPALWGAGAVGIRYATGGNMTTNSRGEQDIAGIPFI